jgi:hypothetical protein
MEFPKDRHATCLGEVLLEAGGADIRQIVGMGLLGQHVLLGARHTDVEGFVHGKTPAGILTVSSLEAGVMPRSQVREINGG